MDHQTDQPPEDALDLGEITPGVAAGHPRPAPGVHPWSPTAFDQRQDAAGEA